MSGNKSSIPLLNAETTTGRLDRVRPVSAWNKRSILKTKREIIILYGSI